MEHHLKHMKDITDKLAAIGVPISEEDQVVTLLGSLPRSFATLVTAIELSGQLIGAESALTGAFRRGTPRDRPTRFGCGDVGHIRRNCPSNLPCDLPTCFGCGDVGHIHRCCPRKLKWHKAKIADGKF